MSEKPFVLLTCPFCGRQQLQPAEETSSDRLLEALAAHVLDQHPDTIPIEAEPALESAVESATVEAFDPDAVEPERWVRPEG